MSDTPTIEVPFASAEQFAADVARDLAKLPKRLQPKYLYDDLGTMLFGAICHLPWYRITRAEKQLLHVHRTAIAMAAGTRPRIVELGCGTGEKLQILAGAFAGRGEGGGSGARIHLVDVSQLALDQTTKAIAGTRLPVVCHKMAYEEGAAHAATGREAGEAVLVLFLGSNIGNFDPPAAIDLLRRIRAPLAPGDHLLLGVDLVKPAADLQMAYDDPLGVTAAFNKNLLVRMNRELDADFDVDAFEHMARWNAVDSRVEMHLVSTRRQIVRIPGAGTSASFFTGETIWTESSYKYEADQIEPMAQLTGFALAHLWVDEDARFALALLSAV